jgi:predicted XRE-type DNA-binding protein
MRSILTNLAFVGMTFISVSILQWIKEDELKQNRVSRILVVEQPKFRFINNQTEGSYRSKQELD